MLYPCFSNQPTTRTIAYTQLISVYLFRHRISNFMASSGLHAFLTLCVSNHSGEHPFALTVASATALLSLIASIERDSTGMELISSAP